MTKTPGPAVAVAGLTKTYGGRSARTNVVDRLSFEIPRGVVAGFVGPNGAGKTTTMAMLLGLVRPSGGTGNVLGAPLAQPRSYLDRVGATIEGPALWPGLTGAQNLRALAALGGHDAAAVPALLDLVGLTGRGDDRYRGYSMGMKQRLSIAASLLGSPELLILDEPSNGLDPVGMRDMRELIARVADGGRTVFVSSHLLGDLEQICDWLLVIDRGELLYQGPAAGFLATAIPQVFATPEYSGDLPRLLELAKRGGEDATRDGDAVLIPVPRGDARAVAVAVNRAAIGDGIVLAELGVRRPDLESHYLAQVGAPKSEGASR
ncbi:MAG TPA: ATP-binding cassette domain-containing protein [Sporichthya sp.]|nr:ATP-binding cassette domain-containing protein [Sporichthya sp.]